MTQSFWLDMLGAKVSYYNAGGINTRCLEAGEGEAVILLHGMGGHAEAYIRNVIPLSRHYHVYAIDMAGHGFTDAPKEKGIQGLIDHLFAFMDAIQVQQAHLVGESLGGWVSTWASLQQPERVKSIISVCGAGLHLDPEDKEAAAAGIQDLMRLTMEAFANPTRENVRNRLAWLFFEPDVSITEELLEVRYVFYMKQWEESKKLGIEPKPVQRGPEWDLNRDNLTRLQLPFYFLWTDHNPTTPWQVAEKAHKVVNGSQFDVMSHCGHWPQYEDADTFNRLVTEFLQKTAAVVK